MAYREVWKRELKRKWNQGVPEQPVTRPGARFYVSVRSGRKSRAILGPYASHMTALANVERGRKLVRECFPHDIDASFASFGTLSALGKVRTFGR